MFFSTYIILFFFFTLVTITTQYFSRNKIKLNNKIEQDKSIFPFLIHEGWAESDNKGKTLLITQRSKLELVVERGCQKQLDRGKKERACCYRSSKHHEEVSNEDSDTENGIAWVYYPRG